MVTDNFLFLWFDIGKSSLTVSLRHFLEKHVKLMSTKKALPSCCGANQEIEKNPVDEVGWKGGRPWV